MKQRINYFIKKDEGNIVLITAFLFIGLLGMAGLVLDGGLVYMTKSHLQKVANASALSGAQELFNGEAAVEEVVRQTLRYHNEEENMSNLDIDPEQKVTVDLTKNVPLTFGQLFGFDEVDVTAHAAAELRTMGRATGAAPLGIDESIPLELYKKYKLKVDSTGVEYGNFGVLALGAPGAKTYEYNLRHGYDEELKVGDILETETGNISGKTRSVIQERVNGCSDDPYHIQNRDCSRIILIPVYKPYNHTENQLKQVEVKGFAYFYITDPMSTKDTSITGMFIKFAGTGFAEENSVNRGAYTIRLTE